MLFNSLEFVLFFPMVVAAYFALSPKYRWIMLLLASYYFYMSWNYKYIVLIVLSTLVDYVAGIVIHRSDRAGVKKLLLLSSLTVNLGLLFFFKYFNFFGDSVNAVFSRFNIFYDMPAYDFLLPVGISFYTFQTLSYTIDIYRGAQKPECHLGRFALFVSFFPQLVAGPIERSVHLLPQFQRTNYFNYERIRTGSCSCSGALSRRWSSPTGWPRYVNLVYSNPADFGGLQNVIATFFFSFQIYCDFSGYSDIAIGSAMILGYDLMTNFRRPYFSANIREFWQRWHISLSSWFRDYVYIPLGGNRVGKWRWYFNLFITFLLSGLWHGAEWTFVIWGALHGLYLVIGIWKQKAINGLTEVTGLAGYPRLLKTFRILITFLLVNVAWVFFRANNMSDALLILGRTFSVAHVGSLNLFHFKVDFFIAFISIALLLLIEALMEYAGLVVKLQVKTSRPVKWAILAAVVMSIFVLGVWKEVDFLYFQF